MEWILGGLGALCCVGSIGYGLYRCCTKNDLTTEQKQHASMIKLYGGDEICGTCDVKKINENGSTCICFDIQVPIGVDNLQEAVRGGKTDDMIVSEFKEVLKSSKGKLSDKITYVCKFKLKSDGQFLVTTNGFHRPQLRYHANFEFVDKMLTDLNKYMNFKKLKTMFKECERFQNIFACFKQCNGQNTDERGKQLFKLINDNNKIICQNEKAKKCKHSDKNNTTSELNLSGADLYDTKSVKQPS